MPHGIFIPIKLTKKANKKNPTAEYIDTKTGKVIRGTLKKRLDTLYIPPAYKNLKLAKSASNKIQIIGQDTAGRQQYIYHDRHKAGLEKRKYGNLAELAQKICRIERDNESELHRIINSGTKLLSKPQLIQIMIYMLRTYHFRIGCEKYAEQYGSHGLSTLKAEHIKKCSNGDVRIKFIGKKGVQNNAVEKNSLGKKVINLLLEHYKAHSEIFNENTGDFLFKYSVCSIAEGVQTANDALSLITSDDIQDFFKEKYDIYATPKMFRTWYANYHMLEFLRDADLNELIGGENGMSKRELSQYIKSSIGEYVSKALNNTPAICRKNYINNRLLSDIVNRPKYYILECKKYPTSESLHKYLGILLIGK